jgi:hypothetical protein
VNNHDHNEGLKELPSQDKQNAASRTAQDQLARESPV